MSTDKTTEKKMQKRLPLVRIKPQNRYTQSMIDSVCKNLKSWLSEQGGNLSPWELKVVGNYLAVKALNQRIARTSPRAADVLFTDKEKCQQLLEAAQLLAQKLPDEELEQVMNDAARDEEKYGEWLPEQAGNC